MGVLPFIHIILLYFSSCGIMCSFCRWRGGSRCIGSTRGNRHASIWWALIHLIMIDARDDFTAVDLIDEIGRLRLIVYSANRRGTRGFIGYSKEDQMVIHKEEVGPRHGSLPIIACDMDVSRSSNRPLANRTTRIFWEDFSINSCSFSL